MFILQWLNLLKSGGKEALIYALDLNVPGLGPGGPEPPDILILAVVVYTASSGFLG